VYIQANEGSIVQCYGVCVQCDETVIVGDDDVPKKIR
jgi:hypothetical protein